MTTVAVGLLGPVTVHRGNDVVNVRGRTGRSVIARLALDLGQPVSTGELARALWDDPPARPDATLRPALSRLRASLGADLIVRDARGIRLAAGGVGVDALSSRQALDHDGADLLGALAAIDRALAAWRGTPLVDVAETIVFDTFRAELDEQRRSLLDRRASVLIQLGRAESALIELEQLQREAPERESTRVHLIDALVAVHDLRRALDLASDHRRQLARAGRSPSADFDAVERRLAAALDGGGPGAHRAGWPNGAVAGNADSSTIAPAERTRRRPPEPPAQRTASAQQPLVGRDREIADLCQLVRSHPVVAVVGPAGVGKSRLVAEFAERHTEPLAIVRLADTDAVADPGAAVLEALGLEPGADDPVDAIGSWASHGRVVIVLDGIDHVRDSVAGLVDELVERELGVHVITTTRRRMLASPFEHVLRLTPLPTTPTHGAPAPAAVLLAESARRKGFPLELEDAGTRAVAHEIVQALDGIPLAVELAAARLPLLGLVGLRDQLASAPADTGAVAIGGGGTATWSLGLLSEAARSLLPALSVFPTTFTASQAGEVPGRESPIDALSELVECSLVEPETVAGRTRYRMLGPIRQAAGQLLTGDARSRIERRYATWAVDVAEQVDRARRANDPATGQRLLDDHHADIASTVGALDTTTADRLALQLAPLLHERAHPLLQRVLFDQLGSSTEGRAAAAWLHLPRGDYAAAIDLSTVAGDDVGADDPRFPTVVFPAIYASLASNDLERAAELAAMVGASSDRDDYVRAAAIATHAFVLAYRGDEHGALTVFHSDRDLLETVRTGGYTDFVRAEMVMHTDLDRSLDYACQGEAAARNDLSRDGVLRAQTQQLAIHLRSGDLKRAAGVALRLTPALLDTAHRPKAWTAIRYSAQVLADGREPMLARQVVEAAVTDPTAPPWPALRVDGLADPTTSAARCRVDLRTLWAQIDGALKRLAE